MTLQLCLLKGWKLRFPSADFPSGLSSALHLACTQRRLYAVTRGSWGSPRGLAFCRSSLQNYTSREAAECARAEPRSSSGVPCQCQEVKRGRGKEEEAGSGRCVGCGLARKGRPRRRADPVARAIMDPAEAVLQEKALKFMVRRWCGQGTSGGGSVGASLSLGLGHPLTAGGGSGTWGQGRWRGGGRDWTGAWGRGQEGAEGTLGWGQQLRHLVEDRPSDSGSSFEVGAPGGARGPRGKGAWGQLLKSGGTRVEKRLWTLAGPFPVSG